MNLWDILLLLALTAAVLGAALSALRRRRRGGCGCGACPGCGKMCGNCGKQPENGSERA